MYQGSGLYKLCFPCSLLFRKNVNIFYVKIVMLSATINYFWLIEAGQRVLCMDRARELLMRNL